MKSTRSHRRRVITSNVLVAALKRAEFCAVRQTGSHLALVHGDGRRVVVPLHRAPLKPGTLKAILREAGMRLVDLGLYL